MGKFIGLATGCANGFTMPASLIYGCSDSDCSGDALWYAARSQVFCIGCCGVRMSLHHLRCKCGSAVLRNVDAAVMHLLRNDDAGVVRSVSNSAYIVFCDCISTVVASLHHRACCLRCKVFAIEVAMLTSSAASAKQYACGCFAQLILRDNDMRDKAVCGKMRSDDGCVSHDALTAVGGEIPKRTRTCFSEYLQCADATASGSCDSSVGIAHTPDGKCADTLSFPNFKAAASRRLKPHAESKESAERILKNANFSNGNVGSRLGATEWTGSITRFFRTSRNGAKSAKRDSPSAPHISPISTSSTTGRIMPRIPNKPSENARKSLAGCGGRFSTKLRIGVSIDTPLESRCSHKGLPSDTVFFKRVT